MEMNEILVEKVVVNMGVGADPDKMKKSEKVIKEITGKTPVKTKSTKRVPDWGLRIGVDIGLKVTLRGPAAADFLKKAFIARENKLNKKSFDKEGNFGFGIREHIELPGVKYDPKLGILGLDVLVTLKKRGYRVKQRKIKKTIVGQRQRIKIDEAIKFVEAMGVEVA